MGFRARGRGPRCKDHQELGLRVEGEGLKILRFRAQNFGLNPKPSTLNDKPSDPNPKQWLQPCSSADLRAGPVVEGCFVLSFMELLKASYLV